MSTSQPTKALKLMHYYSFVIGGATEYFAGTRTDDAYYLPDQNVLMNVVGIHDTTTVRALIGTSTMALKIEWLPFPKPPS